MHDDTVCAASVLDDIECNCYRSGGPPCSHLLKPFGEAERAECLRLTRLNRAYVAAHYRVGSSTKRVLSQNTNKQKNSEYDQSTVLGEIIVRT